MKRILCRLLLTILLTSAIWSTPACADIWGSRHGQPAPFDIQSQKYLFGVESAATANDILSNVARVIGALGTKEGAYYDFKRDEFVNYAAATLITFDSVPISIDLGMLNADGIGLTTNYNVGEALPVENVPVIKFLKYFYLGAGVGYRFLEPEDEEDGDKSWEASFGVSALFKFVY